MSHPRPFMVELVAVPVAEGRGRDVLASGVIAGSSGESYPFAILFSAPADPNHIALVLTIGGEDFYRINLTDILRLLLPG